MYKGYYPFGAERYAEGVDNAYKFTGKERDDEMGLDYSWHRYYLSGVVPDFYGAKTDDYELGRFTQVDPLWQKYPSLSPYHYCGNNPLIFVDPTGLKTVITVDSNNVVIDFNDDEYGGDDPNVYLKRPGSELTLLGAEPPLVSDFYVKEEGGKSSNIGVDSEGYWDRLLRIGAVHYILPPWYDVAFGSGGYLDFKQNHFNPDLQRYNIGVAWGTVMTARDAGNARFGRFMAIKYPFGINSMIAISQAYAKFKSGEKETERSLEIQKWGYRLDRKR